MKAAIHVRMYHMRWFLVVCRTFCCGLGFLLLFRFGFLVVISIWISCFYLSLDFWLLFQFGFLVVGFPEVVVCWVS